jgi:putative oxidoreductase
MFHLEGLTDTGLLCMRIMVGLIYADSGVSTFKDPDARAKSTGLSWNFAIFIGCAELAGGAGIILGILQQLAAIGLILIMGGAIQKKIAVWKTGFWGKHGSEGWYYDLTLVTTLLVIIGTDGGNYVLIH